MGVKYRVLLAVERMRERAARNELLRLVLGAHDVQDAVLGKALKSEVENLQSAFERQVGKQI